MRLQKLIPMLNVTNIDQSLVFYQTALGFEVISDPSAVKEWRWATIRSGNTELMLSESHCEFKLEQGIDPQKNTSWPAIFYFYPDDVEALYQHVSQSGYSPTTLINTFYNMREFSVQDPDGHMLSFGQLIPDNSSA